MGAEDPSPAPVTFSVPTFRVDLKREIDLIEEIARLYGVDKIPATPPRGAIGSNAYDSVHDQFADARRILTGLGLNEAQGQTLISDTAARLATAEPLAALANPLSSDMNVLRPSLLPGLLDSLRHNLNRKMLDVALFELGRVFSREASGQFREERRIAIAITGQRQLLFWSGDDREAKFDIYDLKGLVEEFLENFGLRGISFNRRNESTSLLLESAAIQLGKLPIGQLGQLVAAAGQAIRSAGSRVPGRTEPGRTARPAQSRARTSNRLPAFPSMRRDVAMLVPETSHPRGRPAGGQTDQTRQPGGCGPVRCLPRQERSRRSKEHGLCFHLSEPGTNVDRCGNQRRARESGGAAEGKTPSGGPGSIISGTDGKVNKRGGSAQVVRVSPGYGEGPTTDPISRTAANLQKSPGR